MIRARVWGGRLDSPLFSVKQYARDLEDLFYKMFDKFKRGEKLTHIISWVLPDYLLIWTIRTVTIQAVGVIVITLKSVKQVQID